MKCELFYFIWCIDDIDDLQFTDTDYFMTFSFSNRVIGMLFRTDIFEHPI